MIGLALASSPVRAQEISVPFDQQVLQADTDRLGNFYLITSTHLFKYSPDGQLLASTEWNGKPVPEQIGPWNPLQVMIHERGHRFRLLDPELQTTASEHIDSSLALRPIRMTPGIFNRTLWVMDEDHSIKKIDWSQNRVLEEFKPFVSGMEPTNPIYFRAYQDHILCLDARRGLYIVGRTGKLVRHVPVEGASTMGVLGEDLWIHLPGKIRFIDIYDKQEYSIPVPPDIRMALATDERLLLIDSGRLIFLNFRPVTD